MITYRHTSFYCASPDHTSQIFAFFTNWKFLATQCQGSLVSACTSYPGGRFKITCEDLIKKTQKSRNQPRVFKHVTFPQRSKVIPSLTSS